MEAINCSKITLEFLQITRLQQWLSIIITIVLDKKTPQRDPALEIHWITATSRFMLDLLILNLQASLMEACRLRHVYCGGAKALHSCILRIVVTTTFSSWDLRIIAMLSKIKNKAQIFLKMKSISKFKMSKTSKKLTRNLLEGWITNQVVVVLVPHLYLYHRMKCSTTVDTFKIYPWE
jgi:hypothetical protein